MREKMEYIKEIVSLISYENTIKLLLSTHGKHTIDISQEKDEGKLIEQFLQFVHTFEHILFLSQKIYSQYAHKIVRKQQHVRINIPGKIHPSKTIQLLARRGQDDIYSQQQKVVKLVPDFTPSDEIIWCLTILKIWLEIGELFRTMSMKLGSHFFQTHSRKIVILLDKGRKLYTRIIIKLKIKEDSSKLISENLIIYDPLIRRLYQIHRKKAFQFNLQTTGKYLFPILTEDLIYQRWVSLKINQFMDNHFQQFTKSGELFSKKTSNLKLLKLNSDYETCLTYFTETVEIKFLFEPTIPCLAPTILNALNLYSWPIARRPDILIELKERRSKKRIIVVLDPKFAVDSETNKATRRDLDKMQTYLNAFVNREGQRIVNKAYVIYPGDYFDESTPLGFTQLGSIPTNNKFKNIFLQVMLDNLALLNLVN